ncbi:hypothetical protein OHD62_18795 [Mesorhizobium sp. YC-39]|uniref:hypothetical protein n=1 Tax=unclassified Mesorhizobium TaxID=325217 RepID=UPI0021E7B118|nr:MULTISPECIES: hypothetical protein [unclassified Mesorhizobium]MCV3209891.1 hypothetical protein [Mesorhizobium sp. YC-2]MCV3230421.1 hypothetical protein [Mesorhizobium sp. YC-39]
MQSITAIITITVITFAITTIITTTTRSWWRRRLKSTASPNEKAGFSQGSLLVGFSKHNLMKTGFGTASHISAGA